MKVEKVEFHGNVVEAVRDENGDLWVSVRSICTGVGLDWSTQHRKLSGDEKFTCGHMTTTGKEGKSYEMFCIPLSQLNGWLFSINTNKVREDIRPKLLQYQKECMEVLYKHFLPRGEQDLQGFMAGMGLFVTATMERFNKVEDICRGIRDEVDELRATLSLLISEEEAEILRELIRKAKAQFNCDGRTIVGKLRSMFDVNSLYGTPSTHKIINCLRNLLGKGVFGIVKEDKDEVEIRPI